MARVPAFKAGSPIELVIDQLRTTGRVTRDWANANGMDERTLRRIVAGLKRHGADIGRTGNAYELQGDAQYPVSREGVFR